MAFLLKVLFGLIVTAFEALFILWFMPSTGIPYRPSYWQAFALALIINICVRASIAMESLDDK